MPMYDYKCLPCGNVFEVNKRITDPDPTECPNCKCGPIERHHASDTLGLVQYKGSGWFKTSGKY